MTVILETICCHQLAAPLQRHAMRSHVLVPDLGAPRGAIDGTSQELLVLENHLAQVHSGIRPRPHMVLAEGVPGVGSSLEVERGELPGAKCQPPVTALWLVVF